MKTDKTTKINKRMRKDGGKKQVNRKRSGIIIAVAAVIVVLFIMYGAPIIKLKMENAELKKQNAELQEEKEAKTEELKNVNSKDYIMEQARKQLRLLQKDEKIYTFEEDEESDD